jgi:peptidyl-prolyl cis-trans isomerase D
MFITVMRRYTKSIIIRVMIGLIAVVFVFWGIYTIRGRPGMKVAYVNGDLITGQEYQAIYRQMLEALQRRYGSYWNDNLIQAFQLKQRALDSLINKRLVDQEAHKLGLRVTDDEVAGAILTYPAFQVNGRFDESRYRSLLNYNRMEPGDFESVMRSELLEQKIHQFIKSFFPITDTEAEYFYTYQREKIKIDFVLFDPQKYKGKRAPTDAEKEKYFEEHKEKYRIPAKIKIAYLAIDPSDFEHNVTVSGEELLDYYELNKEQFTTQEQVKARLILLKLSPDASESEVAKVKDKALAIVKEVKAGEDFSRAARAYSQDPTASKGGDLGYITRGQVAKPIEELAFGLKRGEIGGPVRTLSGWALIKVEDIRKATTKALSEVRDQIIATLKKDISKDMAHEKALSLVDQMPYNTDLAAYAAQYGLTVHESSYFSKSEPIPGLGEDERIKRSISSLGKGELSEVIEHQGKFYIIQVVDIKDSYIPRINEVSDQLNRDVEDYLSLISTKKEAEGYLEKLRGGARWLQLAKNKGLKTGETGFFSRGKKIPTIGFAPLLSEAAFSLSSEKRYPDQVFEVEDKIYVIRWLDRKGIDMADFEKEKKSYRQMLLVLKEGRIFDAWLQSLKDKAEIKIVTPPQ